MASILLVEDDTRITVAMTRALTEGGHAVRPVTHGAQALTVVSQEPPDLVLLDLGLPDIDGADALHMMRAVSDVPVIVSTARRSESEIVRLLEAGADDYVTKPFSSEHLLARISAVLRRSRPAGGEPPGAVVVGELEVDRRQRAATLRGERLRLSRREFDVLAYLAERSGQVVGRRELLTEVWRQPRVGEEQTLDVHVSWLRRKLGETAAAPRFIHTVRGVGFMMVEPP